MNVMGSRRLSSRKAQGDIISAIIIVVLTMLLVGTAYMWGVPLIEKQQSRSIVSRMYSYFDRNNANSLPSLIEDVANNGGERVFTSNVDGLWVLNEYSAVGEQNNSIQFMSNTKVSNIDIRVGWVPLTSGATCPPNIGIVGADVASVVCGTADTSGTGYSLTYRLWLRELDDASGTKGYKINLVSDMGPDTSTGKAIRIRRGSVQTRSVSGKTLIITEVKILFE